MINPKPETGSKVTFIQRIRSFWSGLIEPHGSIKLIGEYRRARLLAILTLILTVLFALGTLSNPVHIEAFYLLGGISFGSYILSRTRYYKLGAYVFTYVTTLIGFFRIYQGSASSLEASIASTVHISLIFSSLILSQRGFLSLAGLSTLAAFTAPFYTRSPIMEPGSTALTGGVVLGIGAILYGTQVFRAAIEKERLEELTQANAELEEVKSHLEQRIVLRTQELENANQPVQERAERFQVASEISRDISANINQDPQDLLNRITQTISEKLGFYHVGIFLFDKNREYAVLRASNSAGGQRMLNRQHQLKVGGTGVVGYVSQSGRPRISLDTGSDAVYFNNPDLPETHSEIALPLKYGDRTIGVLDVQSTEASAFTEEDANFLSTLANQIAIIINTIMSNGADTGSFASPRVSVRNRQSAKQTGYSYLPDGTISTTKPLQNSSIDQAIATGDPVILARPTKEIPSSLTIPVKFREQVIGVIHVEAAEANRKWTDDEVSIIQSISDRASFAIENARLFEETERRAEREQLIAKVTSRIGESNNVEKILQTTIQELGRSLGATRTFIKLETTAASADDDATG